MTTRRFAILNSGRRALVASSAGALAILCLPVQALAQEEAAAPLAIADLARTEPVSFADEIHPILKQNCIPCHNASTAKAKLNLESPQAILKGSSDGEVVVPGRAMESLLLLTASHRDEAVMPPPDNKANARNLTADELGLLRLWIDQGATGMAPESKPAAIVWQPLAAGLTSIYACAVTQDQRFVAFGRGNRLFVYDSADGEIEAELVDSDLGESGAAHLDLVQSLDFNRDGLLASGGFRVVKFWQRAAIRRVADLDPPAAAIASVGESPDGGLLVAGGADGEVLVWATGEMEANARRWRDHGSVPVVAAGIRDDDGRVWSVGGDGSLRIRQPANPDEVPVAWNPGTPVSSAIGLGGGRIALGLPDGRIQVVVAEGEMPTVEREWQAHPQAVSALWRQGDGDLLSISAGENQAKRWRIADGGEARAFDHGGAIAAAAASGSVVATAGADHRVKLWNAEDGTLLFDLGTAGNAEGAHEAAKIRLDRATARRDAEAAVLEAASKRVEELAGKAREAAVAAAKAADAALTARGAWSRGEKARREAESERDRRAGAQHPRLAQAEEALKKATESATALKAEFDKLDKEKTGATRNEELARRESVEAARAQAEANASAALAGEEFARATEALAGAAQLRETAAARDAGFLALSGDASRLAGAFADGSVLVWSVKTGRVLDEIPAVEGASPVTALRILANGNVFVARADLSLSLWSGRPAWSIVRRIGDPDQPEILPERVNALAFDGEGTRLATGSGEPSRGGELKVWDVSSGELLKAYPDLHSDSVLDVAFSPDGSEILTTGADRFARIVSLDDAHPPVSLEGHAGHVLAGAWRADGRAVATAGADKVIKVWRPDGGGATQTIEGYGKEVTGLGYAGFREQLVSASGDGSVRLGNDRLPGAMGFQYTCVSSEDGKLVVAGGEDGILRGWLAEGMKPVFELRP